MGPAVAARVRAHAQAMSPLRRCVCVCPRQAVSTKAKLTFVDSHATSRLCHSVGAWDRLAKGQLACMQAALVRGYRCANCIPHRDPTRDRRASAEVLAACGKLGMVTRLALARLRLLAPVVQHGLQALHRLFDYVPCCAWQWVASLGCGGLRPSAFALGRGLVGHGGFCPACLGRLGPQRPCHVAPWFRSG